MRTIKPHAELLTQSPGIQGVYDMIEECGRTCYKSSKSDNITSEQFAQRMIKSNHGAMLEHGTMYFKIPLNRYSLLDYIDNINNINNKNTNEDKLQYLNNSIIEFFMMNKYSMLNMPTKYDEDNYAITNQEVFAYVTTNYRVYVENFIPHLIKQIYNRIIEAKDVLEDEIAKKLHDDIISKYLCEPCEHHKKRITIKMFTDRGVSSEANRHRTDSIAEQSTRYCNYSKNKFGNEITIALNADIQEEDLNDEFEVLVNDFSHDNNKIFRGLCNEISYELDDVSWNPVTTWIFANLATEWSYMKLLKFGWTPQQARRVLPLDLHTELIHTAYIKDWKHFIDLRSIGTTGAPHPDMKIIGDQVKDIIESL